MTSVELFEVEDRAVARSGERAWAFNHGSGWREAPGLVGKASSDGVALSLSAFAARFPHADVPTLPKSEPCKAAA